MINDLNHRITDSFIHKSNNSNDTINEMIHQKDLSRLIAKRPEAIYISGKSLASLARFNDKLTGGNDEIIN